MRLFLLFLLILPQLNVFSQSCTPQGDQNTFGTNNVWIGYVYDNINFTNYHGYVNQGSSISPNFDQSFGGNEVNYATNGCAVSTTTFSVRYKLNRYFTPGSYTITVGGDDGYRLSLDGGTTWIINQWGDHSYQSTELTMSLSGTYNLVLEYYENTGANRVTFSLTQNCVPSENTAVYGTNNVWNAYVYDGTNFENYRGMTNVGSVSNPNFDLNFGGDNVMYHTSACDVQTETFSVRFRLRKNFAAGNYQFTVGGDDGYRLSLDGGSTWLIDAWVLQSYTVRTSGAIAISGDRDVVLEYYENTGSNRISFNMMQLAILPISVQALTAEKNNSDAIIKWTISASSNPKFFQVEKSENGRDFDKLGVVYSAQTTAYSYTDKGISNEVHYYRLRMTDLSGVVSFSDVVRVSASGTQSDNKVSIYPTILSGNNFNIKTSVAIQNARISVLDLQGRPVHTQLLNNLSANQAVSITANIGNAKGMMIVTVFSGNELVSTHKLLVH